jgi:hypothetical protein
MLGDVKKGEGRKLLKSMIDDGLVVSPSTLRRFDRLTVPSEVEGQAQGGEQSRTTMLRINLPNHDE